ncbi:YaaL family protein [Lachnospiraceae bacterium LCP25S3_G4]
MKKSKNQYTLYENTYDIHREIQQTKNEMDHAYNNFQNALDPDLIDCYIFEANAAWKKYRFLLRQAKLL